MNDIEIVQEIFIENMKHGDLYEHTTNSNKLLTIDEFRSNYREAIKLAFTLNDECAWNAVVQSLTYPDIPSDTKVIDYFALIRQQSATSNDPIRTCARAIATQGTIEWLAILRQRYGSVQSYLFRVGLMLRVEEPRTDLHMYVNDISSAFDKLPLLVKKVETPVERYQRIVQPRASTTSMLVEVLTPDATYVPSTIDLSSPRQNE